MLELSIAEQFCVWMVVSIYHRNVLKLLIAERFRFVNFFAHTVRELNASLRV